MYFDTSYIAKFYLEEPESSRIRKLVDQADAIYSSMWAIAEFHAVLHRQVREGIIAACHAREIAVRFSEHIEKGLWTLIPVQEGLLRRTGFLVVSAPVNLFIRTADAVHLVTAQEAGEHEIWTNDRHMLTAAPYFGLTGKSV